MIVIFVTERNGLGENERSDVKRNADNEDIFVTCSSSSKYSIIQRGSKYTKNFRTYIKDSKGLIVSPFHDIPLIGCQKYSDLGEREQVRICLPQDIYTKTSSIIL